MLVYFKQVNSQRVIEASRAIRTFSFRRCNRSCNLIASAYSVVTTEIRIDTSKQFTELRRTMRHFYDHLENDTVQPIG